MPETEIVPYRQEYRGSLCKIHDEARKEELARASLSDAFLPLERIAEKEGLFAYKHIDVALCGGQPVGFCAYSEDELAWLYVLPSAQRRGIGRMLSERALAREAGIHTVEVLCGNEPAIKLYKSLGFVVSQTLCGRMPGNEKFTVKVHVMRR